MSPQVTSVSGVPGSGALAYFALCLINDRRRPSQRRLPPSLRPVLERLREPLIIVRETEEELEDLADALKALAALFDESGDCAFFGEDPELRLASLERLHRGVRLVLATRRSLGENAPAETEYALKRLELQAGLTFKRQELLSRLEALGYRRCDFVEGPGEYAGRGAVVDFFPLEPLTPVRLLYDGDRIETVRSFDPQTQQSFPHSLERAVAAPVRDAGSGGTLKERLGGQGTWIVPETMETQDIQAPCLRLVDGEKGLDFGAAPSPPFAGSLDGAARRCRQWQGQGFKVLLFSMNRGEDERIRDLWESLPAGAVQFLVGTLRRGFVAKSLGLVVLSSGEILGRFWRAGRALAPAVAERSRVSFGELRKGDYVVHEFYGIARYLGLEAVASGEGALDCLKLEFRGGDALYVPMTDFRKVQKYIGAQGRAPRLSSLDSRSWGEVKDRVREGVRELASELLKLQAKRAAAPGHAFGPDSRMEQEFAESFPFEETPDQRRAIEEVKSDMMAPHPMDRLVVGDVGFGKTEVAMRAALKCAAAMRQTAVLVPTTILADQHLRTFRRRFAEYPVVAEMLSRFTSAAEERRVLEGLASGKVDIVIGTHRLFQKDVRFKDLGLVIIDEEHRFGVQDKEKLKKLKSDVDCLTLSATPIPRTLHQGLSGLRAVSLIRSAPAGRQPVTTVVRPFDEGHAATAISEELARGGQAFYVHNRVRSLPQRVEVLRSRLKGVRIAMAHGQMRSAELEQVMWDFFSRKYDVLAASSIIESGLDIPSVNTLLVENAQDFGLAQLYQLRGRIGRERQRAYCYLYYPAGPEDLRNLTEEGRKRLGALREFGQLGSGLALAMRDLEIRGAGDLLGAKQHGFMNAVGVEFYSQLLEAEINRLKGRPALQAPEAPQLDISLPAYIPQDYLPGDLERIEFYKRMLAADAQGLKALRSELEDLSGPAPQAVDNLFKLLHLRLKAAASSVRAVVQKGELVEVYFHPQAAVPEKSLRRWMSVYQGDLKFLRSPEGEGLRLRLGDSEPLAWLDDFLEGLKAGR